VYVHDRQTGNLDSVNRGGVSSISADGRYVAYLSMDNPNFQFRLFVRDRTTDTDTPITVSTSGGEPDGNSLLTSSSISGNGRYVAFSSSATNLIQNDTNGVEDVFVYDLQTDEVNRISLALNGGQANGTSYGGSISTNGRYVAFISAASNLVSGDTNGVTDVFVRDLQTSMTTRVSINNSGVQANQASDYVSLSGNGNFVAFRSSATNLVPSDTNGAKDSFVYDRSLGQIRRVSVSSTDTQANGDTPGDGRGQIAISADGKYVAFSSEATNLVSNDTNGTRDVFVHETTCSCINVSVGEQWNDDYYVPVHGSARQSQSSINGGPVQVEGANVPSIMAAERVIYKVQGVQTSFTEMMGLPEGQLDNVYWLPWYNNVHLDTQLRIANATDNPATVTVTIGGVEMPPLNLDAGESTRVSYDGVNDGPVQIESDQKIVAAERVIYTVQGVQTSFSEMMALPESQLDTTYWLPWYNNKDLDTQLRIANVTDQPATVQVTIGGVVMAPLNLAAGESTRVSYPDTNNGPVQIKSNVDIVAAERVIYKVNRVQTSFSEMMALPESQLDTTYYLPWYNNKDLDTQLRIGNVSGSTATVHVLIGGNEVTPAEGITLSDGESTRLSYPSVNDGPVQIISDQNIVVAERVIYKVNNVQTSFSEMMALPASQLDTTYWFPWYNNLGLDTQLRFGVP
jgi:hypothetical protein